MHGEVNFDVGQAVWRLAATLFFVLLNGFFVAAEFSLVKVRATRVRSLIKAGDRRAGLVAKQLEHLDLYLSGCQLGITVASLILGWLAEPAVATALLGALGGLGVDVAPDNALVHGVALAIALTIVTIFHMTLGEQAPKIWAIENAEVAAMRSSRALWVFVFVLRPLIWLVNVISNWLLRIVGSRGAGHDHPATSEELREILAASARAGQITSRQWEFARNILGFIDLEVRHVLLPRVDVVFLSTEKSSDENMQTIRDSGHSRFVVGDPDLDHVVGFVHAKDVLRSLLDGGMDDLVELARPVPFVPDSQPLGRLIAELQRNRTECAVVVDEYGTMVSIAFLEDALERIVGPIQDEFDMEADRVSRVEPGVFELHSDVALPEAALVLDIDAPAEHDTIGGYVVSELGRLPDQGEQLELGPYRVIVIEATDRRVIRLRFELMEAAEAAASSDEAH